MDKNLRRLVHLVTDIFDITRIEADRVQWRFAPADLSELVGEIVEIMTPLAEERELRLHFRSTGPVSADVDVERIEQVIVNLTDNAIKYSPRGGLISFAVLRENRRFSCRFGIRAPASLRMTRRLSSRNFTPRHRRDARTNLGAQGLVWPSAARSCAPTTEGSGSRTTPMGERFHVHPASDTAIGLDAARHSQPFEKRDQYI